MPAQPLSTVNPSANHGFVSDVLGKHPQFAVHIAKVISLGSIIEHKWTAVFAHLMKSDLEAAAIVYRSLNSSAARRSILDAVAKLRLSDDDFRLMGMVRKATRQAQNLRNDFAHQLWGYSREIPDALLLIDPAYYPPLDASAGIADHAVDKSKIYVYREVDLNEAVREVHVAMLMVGYFTTSIIAFDASTRALMRKALLDQPRIQDLNRPSS